MKQAERRKFHYIYKITRTDGSGKYYIGMHSTDDLDDGYFGSGKRLWYSIKKHGKEKHTKEILEYLQSRKELKIRERELVNEEILDDPLCMNLKLGGEGGSHGNEAAAWKKPSRRDGHKKMLERNWSDPVYREKQSIASSKTMSMKHQAGKIKYDTFTGKSHSEDTKRKIGTANSLLQRGECNSQFGKCWVTDGLKAISIKKELLDEYLTNGYSLGRKVKQSEPNRDSRLSTFQFESPVDSNPICSDLFINPLTKESTYGCELQIAIPH